MFVYTFYLGVGWTVSSKHYSAFSPIYYHHVWWKYFWTICQAYLVAESSDSGRTYYAFPCMSRRHPVACSREKSCQPNRKPTLGCDEVPPNKYAKDSFFGVVQATLYVLATMKSGLISTWARTAETHVYIPIVSAAPDSKEPHLRWPRAVLYYLTLNYKGQNNTRWESYSKIMNSFSFERGFWQLYFSVAFHLFIKFLCIFDCVNFISRLIYAKSKNLFFFRKKATLTSSPNNFCVLEVSALTTCATCASHDPKCFGQGWDFNNSATKMTAGIIFLYCLRHPSRTPHVQPSSRESARARPANLWRLNQQHMCWPYFFRKKNTKNTMKD